MQSKFYFTDVFTPNPFKKMVYSRLLPLRICEFPLQNYEVIPTTWHAFKCSIPICIYSSNGIVDIYPQRKQFYQLFCNVNMHFLLPSVL